MAIKKILVVDDSKTELMFLSDLLVKMVLPLKLLKTRKTHFAALRKTSPS